MDRRGSRAIGMRDGYLRGVLSRPATPRQLNVVAVYVSVGGSVPDAAELVGIRGKAGAKAVFGDAVERDGITVIPVARVRWGVGAGGGEGPEGSGSGGGGGVVADPIGYIEVTSAGATFRPIPRSFGPGAVLGGALALAIVLRALARFRR